MTASGVLQPWSRSRAARPVLMIYVTRWSGNGGAKHQKNDNLTKTTIQNIHAVQGTKPHFRCLSILAYLPLTALCPEKRRITTRSCCSRSSHTRGRPLDLPCPLLPTLSQGAYQPF